MGTAGTPGTPTDAQLWILVTLAIAIGLIFTILNVDLPIVRNSFSYAKGAIALADSGFDVLAVAQDMTFMAGKPILFSLIAAPFAALLGANAGTIIASTLGTVFFLCMAALCLQRLTRHTAEGHRVASLAFALTALNPLVVYQFWSAHPDSLFAGFVLAALVLTDIIAAEPERDTRWHIVGLGAMILLAIHTKFYGAILAIACSVYLVMNWRTVGASAHLRSKLVIAASVALFIGAVLVLARLRRYPFLNLDSGMGVKEYAQGFHVGLVNQAVNTIAMYAFVAALLFHASLVFLFRAAAFRAWKADAVIFISIYLSGLLTYYATWSNMRYLLPALPLIAAAIAMGASKFQPRSRWAVLSAYALVSAISILHFNSAAFSKILQPVMSEAYVRRDTRLLLDNLRLPAHLEFAKQISDINSHLSNRSTLYWVSNYYGSATHGLGHDLGIRDDIRIHYVFSFSQIPRSVDSVVVLRVGADPAAEDLPEWAWVTKLQSSRQSGILRLDPFFVTCEVTGTSCANRCGTTLRAKATVPDSLSRSGVAFVERGQVLSVVHQPPFEIQLPELSTGRHEIAARVTGPQGESFTSAIALCPVDEPVTQATTQRTRAFACDSPISPRPEGSASGCAARAKIRTAEVAAGG